MGIRTHDSITMNNRAVLGFDEGTGVFTITIDGTVVYSSSSLSAAELAYLDIASLGTGAASKAVVLDAAGNFLMPATGMIGLSRAALAATGSDAAGAAAITTQVAAVTAAVGTNGVALPAAAIAVAAGVGPILVINTVANQNLLVYPVSGGNDNINGLAEDLPFTMGPGQAAWFIPTSATQWYVAGSSATVALAKGSGVSAMESYSSGVFKAGGLITTRIVIDLTGLVGSATDLDIIGNTGGAANAHLGQITAAVNGTLIGGRVTCLEVPAGGSTDIDFYSATVGTGAQDVDVTTLTETALVTSGGAWTSGASKGMPSLPPANDYLYACNGAASGGTFSAGKFLIELFGV